MSDNLDDDSLETEINTLATTQTILRSKCLGLLRQRLTKRNLQEMFDKYYYRICDSNIAVRIAHRTNDPNDPYDIIERHIITVAHCRDSFDRDTALSLVRSVFPYLVLSDKRHETDDDTDDIHGTVAYSYEIVSRTQHLSANLRIKSEIPEDNISTCIDYIRYCRFHTVSTARGIESSHAYLYDAQDRYISWRARYRATLWCNLQELYLDWCIALAPLRLAPYEVLWILDWLPHVVSPHLDADHRPYDFNHLHKLRLIEKIAEAWKRAS